MTVQDNGSRIQYTATAGQTVFAYPFEIADESDISVYANSAILTLNVNYTVSGVGSASGGNITLTIAAVSGVVYTLVRDMDFDRDTDYQNSGDFLAATVNNDFDRLWMAVQQLEVLVGRALQLKITSSATAELPEPEANKVIGWDATGDSVRNYTADEFLVGAALETISFGKNWVINGAMAINQRALSAYDSVDGAFIYTVDRMSLLGPGVTGTFRAEPKSDNTTFEGGTSSINYLRITNQSGATLGGGGNDLFTLDHRIETLNIGVFPFVGKQATISFKARANAPTDIIVGWSRFLGTGGTGGNFTSEFDHFGGATINLTTAFQKYSVTIDIDDLTGRVLNATNSFDTPNFRLLSGVDDAASFGQSVITGLDAINDYIDITDLQVEVGSVATDFEARPLQEEIALCQRYYETGSIEYSADVTNTNLYRIRVPFQTAKRVAPDMSGTPVSANGFANAIGTLTSSANAVREERTATGTVAGAGWLTDFVADAEL
jgi:hypothetical protein